MKKVSKKSDKKIEKAVEKTVLCEVSPLSEALAILKRSPEFKKWRELHPSDFLASAFTIMEGKKAEWQFSFYNGDRDSVVSFTVSDLGIGILPESAVFREPEQAIAEIKEAEINLDIHKAIEIASKCQGEKYPKERPIKVIAVLAGSGGRNIWSITYLTQNFKTLVMKVDASSGELISHRIISFFSYE